MHVEPEGITYLFVLDHWSQRLLHYHVCHVCDKCWHFTHESWSLDHWSQRLLHYHVCHVCDKCWHFTHESWSLDHWSQRLLHYHVTNVMSVTNVDILHMNHDSFVVNDQMVWKIKACVLLCRFQITIIVFHTCTKAQNINLYLILLWLPIRKWQNEKRKC